MMTPEQSAEALAVLRRITSERPPAVSTSEAYDGDEPYDEPMSDREEDYYASRAENRDSRAADRALEGVEWSERRRGGLR